MLDRTGDTDCKVNVRTYCLTGLAYLKVFRLPACVNNRTGTAYRTAKYLCKVFQNLEVFRAANAASAGYQDLSIHDISYVGYCLDYL